MGFSQTQSRGKKAGRKQRGTRGGRRARSKKEKSVKGDGIFNLNSQVLTKSEITLLNKGLKFAPPQEIKQISNMYGHLEVRSQD